MIILDASPLIVLAKIGRLRILKELYSEVIIGPWVKREVIEKAGAIDAPGARQVELGIAERWIREVRPTAEARKLAGELLQGSRLGEGEAESLALARVKKLPIVLDDKEARMMAEAMGVKYLGTAGVLLEAFVRGRLTYEGLEETVGELGGVLWLSPDVVTEILKRARELKE